MAEGDDDLSAEVKQLILALYVLLVVSVMWAVSVVGDVMAAVWRRVGSR